MPVTKGDGGVDMNGEQHFEAGEPRSPEAKADTETLTRTLEQLQQELAQLRSQVDAVRKAGAPEQASPTAEAQQAGGDGGPQAPERQQAAQAAGQPERAQETAPPPEQQPEKALAEGHSEPMTMEDEEEAPEPQQAEPEQQQQQEKKQGEEAAPGLGVRETVALFDGSAESFEAWARVGAGALERGEEKEEDEEEARGTLRLRVEREQRLAYYPKRQFADFRVHLRYRPNSPNSESTLAVRFRDPAQPVPERENPEVRHAYDNQAYVASHTGFEVHLGAGTEPDAEAAAAGTFAGIPFGDDPGAQQHAQDAELNPDGWNELTVEVRGDDYSVWLNGAQTAHFVNDDPYRGKPAPEGGFVGLVTKAAAAPESAAKSAAPSARGGGGAPARRPVGGGGGPSVRPPPGPPPSWLTAPIIGGRRPSTAAAGRRPTAQRAAAGSSAAATAPAAGAWLEIQRVEVEVLGEERERAGAAEEKGEAEPKKHRRRRQKVLSAQEQKAIREEVTATKARLKAKDSGLEPALQKAYAYAIVPAVGRASLVVGVAHGYGEVFEQGKSLAFCAVTQITVGVQVGGQTFSEVLLFNSKEVLQQFLRGTILFNANLSAVLLRGASGTVDAKGATIRAYSRGGMLLEASLGGQKFRRVDTAGEGAAGEAARPAERGARREPQEALGAVSSRIGGVAKSALGIFKAHRAH